MKQILFGISLQLMGVISLLIAWMGEIQNVDIVGLIFGTLGFVWSITGLVNKKGKP